MPKNIEYMIFVYGFAVFVISAYAVWIYFKLRSIARKSRNLTQTDSHEAQKA